ncbi:hypothetical protein [Acanthopleuribacter pedis]|uniref:PI3K/PI4K catalytic domain-containing protein n=1 Tax=Acanthopleuribacter pedis TaxID=442870 RepID=A0A8J7QLQ5_9BACT|nr:hypothetical protein [Acanthopleuribacter pedis]MBO1320275.1 hypothetical protein [Acanthopleuribacter pedis]
MKPQPNRADHFWFRTLLWIGCFALLPLWGQTHLDEEPVGTRALRDSQGRALANQDHAWWLNFLREAEVVAEKPIGGGITNPLKLTLRHEGREINAIFRHLFRYERNVKVEGDLHPYFFDSYKFEVAAYTLAQLLELDRIPPVIYAEYKGRKGSLQVWIENARTEKKRRDKKIAFPGHYPETYEYQQMLFFDLLVWNFDRHEGNFLYDTQWCLWYIDHTRTFRADPKLHKPERLTRVPRKLWERFTALTKKDFNQALKPHLNAMQLHMFHQRRKRLTRYVTERISTHGESAVLLEEPNEPPQGTANADAGN